MYVGRIVFAHVMDVLPMHEFRKCVRRYQGERHVRTFSCLDQFLCMAFAQLTYRESLRDIVTCLRAMSSKVYHAGIRGRISRSTMADANERRDWRLYHDFAQVLIAIARCWANSLPARGRVLIASHLFSYVFYPIKSSVVCRADSARALFGI